LNGRNLQKSHAAITMDRQNSDSRPLVQAGAAEGLERASSALDIARRNLDAAESDHRAARGAELRAIVQSTYDDIVGGQDASTTGEHRK